MTPEEFEEEMRFIQKHKGEDTEVAHGDMDDLLCKALRESKRSIQDRSGLQEALHNAAGEHRRF